MKKSKLSSTSRLQCPECRMELLPGDYNTQNEHITCCRCGREIYVPICEERPEKETRKSLEETEWVVSCCC